MTDRSLRRRARAVTSGGGLSGCAACTAVDSCSAASAALLPKWMAYLPASVNISLPNPAGRQADSTWRDRADTPLGGTAHCRHCRARQFHSLQRHSMRSAAAVVRACGCPRECQAGSQLHQPASQPASQSASAPEKFLSMSARVPPLSSFSSKSHARSPPDTAANWRLSAAPGEAGEGRGAEGGGMCIGESSAGSRQGRLGRQRQQQQRHQHSS